MRPPSVRAARGRAAMPAPPPALPPGRRSRVALGLTAAAALGRFELQVCAECGTVQYPPREVCHRCLSGALRWREQNGLGELLSAGPEAARVAKLLARAPLSAQETAQRIAAQRTSAEGQEGLRAFLEKRAAGHPDAPWGVFAPRSGSQSPSD